MSGSSAFDRWWAARSINDRLSFLHHDREMYTREGWEAGAFTERARLREKVAGLRDRIEPADAATDYEAGWEEALAEVLTLLGEPGGAQP